MKSVSLQPYVRLAAGSVVWELLKNISIPDLYCIKLDIAVCSSSSVAGPVYRDQGILWLDCHRVTTEIPFITISADLDRDLVHVLRSSSFVVVAKRRLRHSIDYIAVLRIRLLVDLVIPLVFCVCLASSNNVPELPISDIKLNSLLSSISLKQRA